LPGHLAEMQRQGKYDEGLLGKLTYSMGASAGQEKSQH